MVYFNSWTVRKKELIMSKTTNISKTQMALQATWSVLSIATLGHPISGLVIIGSGLAWVVAIGKIIGSLG